MALTDTEIKKAKAREKAYSMADGGGLYLWVTTPVGVEKVSAVLVILGLNNVVASVLTATSYEVAGTGDIGDRLRNRTSRLMF